MTQNKQAFTLIELLVVVLIVGVLSAVALPQYQRAVEKARMTEAFTLLSSVAKAEKIYYLANGEYTDDLNDLDIGLNEETDKNGRISMIGTRIRLYIRRAPIDGVIYAHRNDTITWRMYYYLEEDKMYCAASESDADTTTLCKSFGGIETIACGASGQLTCYEIKL